MIELLKARAKARPKVALIAVASNEAAYISSFVFHHLSLGFDPIVLVVNRSQDGTEEIVRRIADRFSGVRLVQGDDLVEQCAPKDFQVASYRKAIAGLRGEIGDDDYICFLDVDEYWTPRNTATDIQDYLAGYGYPDIAAFNWFVPDNDDQLFLLPFQDPQQGIMNPHVKTVWRAALRDRRFNAHNILDRSLPPLGVSIPLLGASLRNEVQASGVALHQNRCKTEVTPSGTGTACVVHQMYRSMVEYVAVLGRGRPRRNAMFKDNRAGYRTYRQRREPLRHPLPVRFGLDWRDGYAQFVDAAGVLPLVLMGRRMTLKRARETFRTYQALPREEKLQYGKLFQNVEWADFRAQLDEATSSGALGGLFPSHELQAEHA